KRTLEKDLVVVLDCSIPANDSIFDDAAFEKYLHDHIKVDNRVNNLGNKVTITREDAVVTVTSKVAFAKRYFKYLAKKFLKKHQLRDWIRVLSIPNGYQLKYFNINQTPGEVEEEEDDEEEASDDEE
ncbi:60S ribosomal protein L22, partial [Dimargaris verticillata]